MRQVAHVQHRLIPLAIFLLLAACGDTAGTVELLEPSPTDAAEVPDAQVADDGQATEPADGASAQDSSLPDASDGSVPVVDAAKPDAPAPNITSMELPKCDGKLMTKTYYTICHDNSWLIAAWVAYPLKSTDLDGPASRTDDFRADPALTVGHRAENSDYLGSGYDRGHMAPAEDFDRNTKAMSESFFLSNMSPQTTGLNRGAWSALEERVRTLTSTTGFVQILSGNLFLDSKGQLIAPIKRIGSNHVAVPTHLWKAVLTISKGKVVAHGFLLPNTSNPPSWQSSQVSVDKLETLTGLDLFRSLDDATEASVESVVSYL